MKRNINLQHAQARLRGAQRCLATLPMSDLIMQAALDDLAIVRGMIGRAREEHNEASMVKPAGPYGAPKGQVVWHGPRSGPRTEVYFGNDLTGHILDRGRMADGTGFRYCPKGRVYCAPTHDTFAQCFASLTGLLDEAGEVSDEKLWSLTDKDLARRGH